MKREMRITPNVSIHLFRDHLHALLSQFVHQKYALMSSNRDKNTSNIDLTLFVEIFFQSLWSKY